MLAEAQRFNSSRPDFALVLNGKAASNAAKHVTLYTKKGLLRNYTLAGLAERLGVTADVLRETFAEYNAAAAKGVDEFGRKVFPKHWPVEEAEEFYVGVVTPVIHYTMGGILIDTDGRILSEDGNKPISGLFAAGEASGGVHGNNRLAGNSLLECTVYGRHVGLTIPIAADGAVGDVHKEYY